MGGKAYNLQRLAAAGLPVPPAFVLPTSMCSAWIGEGPPDLQAFRSLIGGAMERLERASGLRFGDVRGPLLVSVRSGAPALMPGMLDTVLDVGLTRGNLAGLVAASGNPRLAADCFLRMIESYARTVCELDLAPFRAVRAAALAAAGGTATADLDTLELREIGARYLHLYREVAETPFPEDPYEQLREAVNAVFRSWGSERARRYRELNGLQHLPGTGVVVQRMVFGNAGPRSGAGVGFTRNPSTGEKELYLDFAFNGQGEDVVSGREHVAPTTELRRLLPEVYQKLSAVATRLEEIFRDVQDFEFTIEEGQLFLLQTRTAKLSSWARLRTAVDLVHESLIDATEALHRLDGFDLPAIVRRTIATDAGQPIARGTPAGGGVATGGIALSVETARAQAAQGNSVILVRPDMTTDDIEGLVNSTGVVTAHGGRTSHAAVVARELGKAAVVGCTTLEIAQDASTCIIGGHRFGEGDVITIDGGEGHVYVGAIPVIEERPEHELAEVEMWKLGGRPLLPQ